MPSTDEATTLKLLLVGNSGTGKSAVLLRYCDDLFDGAKASSTIGVDFRVKKLSVHGKAVRLHILDTAGQERFRTLTSSHYRNAHGVLVMFSLIDRISFDALDGWFDEINAYSPKEAVTLLIGGKADMESERAVSDDEARALAERRGAIGYVEVSAKTGKDVRESFVKVVEKIVQKPELLALGQRTSSSAVDLTRSKASDQGYCAC